MLLLHHSDPALLNRICFTCLFQNVGPDEGAEASSLQARLPALSRKMKKICIRVQRQNPVPDLAEDLDYFTGKALVK